MAKGDTKHSRLRRGGYGRYNHYDDKGRGNSKWLWLEFESHFNAALDLNYAKEWLMGTNVAGVDPALHKLFTDTEVNRFFAKEGAKTLLQHGLYDGRLYCYIQNMRDRYAVHDFAWNTFDDSEVNDGRMRRLIIKKLGLDTWHEFQDRARDVYHNIPEQKKQEEAEQADENEQAQAVFKAEKIKRDQEEIREIRKETDLIAGAIRSEFDQAFSLQENFYQVEGDWLDDPIEGVRTGYGFGEEVKRPSGVKLQVTTSIDLSNSMKSNRVDAIASEVFRDIYMALEEIQKEHPNDLYIAAFTFANNGHRANMRGRIAQNLSLMTEQDKETGRYKNVQKKSTDSNLGPMEWFKNSKQFNHFTGEDTWFYPLFEKIELWENNHSEPGTIKLDIIITDAVIEHPSDIRRSDVIQERRNGDLQTVMLNFLDEREWANSDLPSRCVQYPASEANIAGLLRNILTEFVSVYL